MARHLLITNDYPPKTGGIQVYLHELWRRLETGRAVVVTASSHADAVAFDAQAGIAIERIAASTLYLPTRKNLRFIEEAIAQHDPEVVILDPAWPLGLLGPRLSRSYGVVLHGAEVTIPGRLPLVASSLRYILRHATFAIAAGGYPEAEARRNAGDDMPEVIQIPVGVDTSQFQPLDPTRRRDVRRAMGLPEDGFLIASYSRLVPRKGMDRLIRAAAQLRTEIPDLHVAIGGSGRDRSRLEKLVARLRAPVTFLGRVPDDQLSAWLGASDVMVMDCRSRWLGLEQEGFGIVFLEAAACGVAQVAGRSGGSHEAVRDGETGLVVQHPRSVRELAEAIRQLHGDREHLALMGFRARDMVVAHYDWGVLAQQLGRALDPYDRHVPISPLT